MTCGDRNIGWSEDVRQKISWKISWFEQFFTSKVAEFSSMKIQRNPTWNCDLALGGSFIPKCMIARGRQETQVSFQLISVLSIFSRVLTHHGGFFQSIWCCSELVRVSVLGLGLGSSESVNHSVNLLSCGSIVYFEFQHLLNAQMNKLFHRMIASIFQWTTASALDRYDEGQLYCDNVWLNQSYWTHTLEHHKQSKN